MVYLSCRERIVRADAHFEACLDLWDDFLRGDPYRFVVKAGPDGTATVAVVPQFDRIPPDLSFEVGEMLYQLRSALDAMVYEAAIQDSGYDPPPKAEHLRFPFENSREEFLDSSWQIRSVSDRHRDMIEALQPYNVHSVIGDERAVICCLASIEKWFKVDRQRKLRLAGRWKSRARPTSGLPGNVTISDFQTPSKNPRPSEGRKEIARFTLEGWEPGMELEANPSEFVDLCVAEASPLEPHPRLQEVRNQLLHAVQVVLKRFEGSRF